MMPDLTVVVPVYNRAGLIERCLDSIASQHVRPLSIIVVDNNSTDNTKEVVNAWIQRQSKDWGLVVKLLDEPRQGAAMARQTGLEWVESEWVSFFDSDDVMIPGILDKALELGQGHDLVYWKRQIIGPDGKPHYLPFRKKAGMRAQFFNTILSTQSYIIKTAFILDADGWDVRTRVWDDWELGIRLLLRHPDAISLPKCGVMVYPQQESITGTDFGSKCGEWEQVLDLVESQVNNNRNLREMVDYRRVILAAHYKREGNVVMARDLLEQTLRNTSCSPARKTLLKIIYRYTAAGGRAAYKLWR